MDLKELSTKILSNFFMIFSLVILSMVVYIWLLGGALLSIYDVIGAFWIAVPAACTELFFYSKKELRFWDSALRHICQMVACAGISFAVGFYLRWFSLDNPRMVAHFFGLFFGSYVLAILIDLAQTKKTADELNVKLNERYNKE